MGEGGRGRKRLTGKMRQWVGCCLDAEGHVDDPSGRDPIGAGLQKKRMPSGRVDRREEGEKTLTTKAKNLRCSSTVNDSIRAQSDLSGQRDPVSLNISSKMSRARGKVLTRSGDRSAQSHPGR